MAMVDRYRKKGGFVQLLKVIETCNPKKRAQLIEIIAQETPEWAAALDQKILTFEKVMAWPSEVLLEVIFKCSHLPFVTALKSLPAEERQVFLSKLSHQEAKKIERTAEEINPNAVEMSSSVFKVITEVREMMLNGSILVDRFDPSLSIPENFESSLKTFPVSIVKSDADDAIPVKQASGIGSGQNKDLIVVKQNQTQAPEPKVNVISAVFDLRTENRVHVLKSKITELTQKVSILLDQNKLMREELEKRKKDAA